MKTFLLLACMAITSYSFAGDPSDSLQFEQEQLRMIDSIESKLHYKTGKVALYNGNVTINVPANYKFLDSADTRYILEDVWGNLKGQTALGMLVPINEAASVADYAFIVEYSEVGYIKDDDAADINYDDLMKEMQEDGAAAKEERKLQGIPYMQLMGWAAKPLYDEEKNVLYWAKELKVEGSDENTLNYDVRILGRKGMLVLKAVSGMSQLDSVEQNIDPLLNAVSFTAGNKYSDFNSSTDNVAAWTIGGLVAGKVLAKAGLFAFIMKFLKVIIVGLVALGGMVVKFFKKKKEKEQAELLPETTEEPVA